MIEAEFTELVQSLRTEASHWFNNAALLELERLIMLAERGFEVQLASSATVQHHTAPLDNPPSGV